MTRFRPELRALEGRVTPVTLPTGFAEAQLAGGLSAPTGLAAAPDGRVFVTEQGGALRVVRGGAVLPAPALTVTTDPTGERGLIGVTLDPNFAANGFVYVYYTVPAAGAAAPFNRVSRFTLSGDVAVPGSELVLLNLDPLTAATNHNGGGLRFGADGKLYVAVGENNTPSNSQTLTNRLGKLLRINPDGTIPGDNPTTFAGLAGATAGANRAIWAVGLRNPFSFAVQPGTGRVFINDVGGTRFEEIDAGAAGANYGWPATEGDFDPAAFPNFTRPLYNYARTGDPNFSGRSINGGTFYNPSAIAFPGDYVGDYFFLDLTGGWINRLDPDTNAVSNFATAITGKFPVGMAVGARGELLYVARGTGASNGAVFQVTFSAPTPFASPGATVTAVGARAGGSPFVGVYDPASGREVTRFPAFDADFVGGVRVAVGDVTGDRVADVVAGAGPGGGPRVSVFDGATGLRVRDLFAFEATFTGGVSVAAGDVNRDGFADVIVSPDFGGGPRVRVLSGKDGATLADFFAFESAFRGGARTAVGDIDADGVPDVVVAAGTGGGPRVGVVNGRTLAPGAAPARIGGDFFAYEAGLRDGAFVASADVTGDAAADLLVGAGPGGGPRVRAFSGRAFAAGAEDVVADFFAGDPADRSGLAIATADADVVAVGAGRAGVYRILFEARPRLVRDFPALDGLGAFVG